MERKRSVRRRQKPPFAERAKDHCRKFTAFMFSNVGIIFLVVLYTIAGECFYVQHTSKYCNHNFKFLNSYALNKKC